ncbi:N-formylglutamate amidohydrolase [Rhodovulum iodosum]|uniref:N-formylglutamate amidohydrolase n=1 Tax=Rhodovulum iodosum TaxID=68291 RepID=UPI000F66B0A5|nr:N-formylglutamate amidohydrolase [Rhodovulum robiginosum]RSK40775.1 N-formylglutamate amidohydrolase [Rhodovulum robiginosum]
MRYGDPSESSFEGPAAEVVNASGRCGIVLVCDHASAHIPEAFGTLGLAEADRHAHAVWDPGAESLSRALSARLDAPLVLGRVSRLVHDCNRPPASAAATPDRVERIEIPGNRGLTERDREMRAQAVYHPFHRAVEATLAGQGAAPVLVTVHSFSPTWHGVPRETEIGLLHDAEAGLARAMLAAAGTEFRTELNQPYAAADGVTHTLARHGEASSASVMIELRNDLLADAGGVARAADALAGMLAAALAAGVPAS